MLPKVPRCYTDRRGRCSTAAAVAGRLKGALTQGAVMVMVDAPAACRVLQLDADGAPGGLPKGSKPEHMSSSLTQSNGCPWQRQRKIVTSQVTRAEHTRLLVFHRCAGSAGGAGRRLRCGCGHTNLRAFVPAN